MEKMIFIILFSILLSCTTGRINVPDKYVNKWGYVDGVRVDSVISVYDYLTGKETHAGIVGKDTIWVYRYWRQYIQTDSGLFYIDEDGVKKF